MENFDEERVIEDTTRIQLPWILYSFLIIYMIFGIMLKGIMFSRYIQADIELKQQKTLVLKKISGGIDRLKCA